MSFFDKVKFYSDEIKKQAQNILSSYTEPIKIVCLNMKNILHRIAYFERRLELVKMMSWENFQMWLYTNMDYWNGCKGK